MKTFLVMLLLVITSYSQTISKPSNKNEDDSYLLKKETFLASARKDFTKQPITYQNPQTPTMPVNPYCDANCKASIAAYISGAGLDVYSSLGHREANPLWRDSKGMFNATSNSVYKAGILALTMWKQKDQPERMNYIRYLGAALFGAAGSINFARAKSSSPIF